MPQCPTCTAAIPADRKACSSCGAPLPPPSIETSTPSQLPTVESNSATSEPTADSRFVPGQLLDNRYRIVGLLGRGGMGEVYRADDLKLGQSVALKFLPQGLDRDPQRLARFLEELRTARRVTHSNVCRVYDIAEANGHYLST